MSRANAGAYAASLIHAAPEASRAGGVPPDAPLKRLLGEDAEMVEHIARGAAASGDARPRRQNDRDDLCLDFVVASGRSMVNHRGVWRLHAGDLVVIDGAQPHAISRARHRIISLFLPRAKVRAAFGEPERLAGRKLAAHGVPALLRSHMLATMDQAAHLRPDERMMAVRAASDMAFCILRAQGGLPADEVAEGSYHAALLLIAREYQRPELNAELVAASLGCSRAALYRMFAGQRGSVAGAIWAARLEAARQLLVSDSCRTMRISDLAYRCGFADPASFGRMFKRLHGVTPREMREGG